MKQGLKTPQGEIEKLFQTGRRLDYKKGEILQRANETPRGVYFLSEGHIKEYSLSTDGSEHITGLYQPGELFSIMWTYIGVNQNLYREAYTDVVVWRLPADVLKTATETNPLLTQEMTLILMQQMNLLKLQIENLTFNNAYDKVAYRLLYLAGRFGIKQADGWFIPLSFRHQHIADSLSMTRETASRMLERIQRQGLVTHDGKGHFIIRNPSGLARTIGVDEVLVTWPQFIDKPGDNNHK